MFFHSNLRNLEENVSNINNPNIPKSNYQKKKKDTVCKYWLEGRCSKGESCEFLHSKIKEKLPECPHGTSCKKIGCPFKHTPKIKKECIVYSNGYCKDGKNCKNEHIFKTVCINYLLGFCPSGPNCKFYHLKSLINPVQDDMQYLSKGK